MQPHALPTSQTPPNVQPRLLVEYLAVPYTDPVPAVQRARYMAVTHAAAKLWAAGQMVFSPITHSHPIKLAGNLSGSWDDYAAYDTFVIQNLCSGVCLLTLLGWESSVGVRAELKLAEELGLPVRRLDPEDVGLTRSYPYFYGCKECWRPRAAAGQPLCPECLKYPN